jgi:hypothetical protein
MFVNAVIADDMLPPSRIVEELTGVVRGVVGCFDLHDNWDFHKWFNLSAYRFALRRNQNRTLRPSLYRKNCQTVPT